MADLSLRAFKPNDQGVFQVKRSEVELLTRFLVNQMEKSSLRTKGGNLSKTALDTTKILIKEKGGEIVKGFLKEKGNGKWNIQDKDKLDASASRRNVGATGITKMEDVQLDFLIEAQEIKDEFTNNPSPNAAKKSNRQMEALFKKYKRIEVGKNEDGKREFFRSGEYDESQWESYGLPKWYADLPEGTNIKDVYKKWKKDVYNQYKPKNTKGHVKPVSQGGTNAPTSLVDEPAGSNYATQDKVGTFRSDDELALANIAHSGPSALQEFILQYDPSVKTPIRYSEKDRLRMSTELDTDIQAIESQAEDNLWNTNRANFLSLGPDPRNSHLLRNITSDTIGAYENRFIKGAENVSATVLEHGVNLHTGSKLGTNVRTGLRIGKKLKDKDFIGAALDATNLEHTTTTPYYGLPGN